MSILGHPEAAIRLRTAVAISAACSTLPPKRSRNSSAATCDDGQPAASRSERSQRSRRARSLQPGTSRTGTTEDSVADDGAGAKEDERDFDEGHKGLEQDERGAVGKGVQLAELAVLS